LLPLIDRRAILKNLLYTNDVASIRLSDDFTDPPQDLLKSACKLGLEGIILKKAGASYTPSRTADWFKFKFTKRQEFIINGYTEPHGLRTDFGAL